MAHEALKSFRHGVHPDDHKGTASTLVERLPFPSRYILPLAQNLGAPSKAIVSAGQTVQRGQLIAEPSANVSTSLHSPVAGQVVAVGPRRQFSGQLTQAIEIEADRFSTQQMPQGSPIDWQALSPNDFIEQVRQAGLVGMGGAAFPAHVKYATPEGKSIQWLVVNGCECEPYLTCDHRVMVERPDAVIRGSEILGKRLAVQGIKIGVEENKAEAIDALRQAIPRGLPIDVVPLHVKYPQGAEKMLIKAIFGQEVPAGGLPLDLGIVVNNVATIAALADYFDKQQPLIERVLTVAGAGVERPSNLLVPIGTSVRDVLNHCGLKEETRQVIMGGPMMGQPLASLDVPVQKGTSGLLAFTEAEIDIGQEYNCIRCGRCLDACANFLNPSRLARLARAGLFEEMESHFVQDCMECGACTYACPSGLPIVQLLRVAKAVGRERKQRDDAK